MSLMPLSRYIRTQLRVNCVVFFHLLNSFLSIVQTRELNDFSDLAERRVVSPLNWGLVAATRLDQQ
jgi:hypothetical protein